MPETLEETLEAVGRPESVWVHKRARKKDQDAHEAIQQSLISTFGTDPVADLGLLSKLPNEVMAFVILEMDLSSVFHLGRVNRLTRHLVCSVSTYRLIILHAVDCFQHILRTSIGTEYTLKQLFDILCIPKCSLCPNMAAHLFLPTAQRVCRICSMTQTVVGRPDDIPPRTPVILPAAQVLRKFPISISELRSRMPMVRPLAKKHEFDIPASIPVTLCTEEQAVRALELYGLDNEENRSIVVKQFRELVQRQPDGSLVLHDRRPTFTSMAMAALPIWDERTKGLLVTYTCGACNDFPADFKKSHLPRIYSRDDMLEHIKTCRLVRILHTRHPGKLYPPLNFLPSVPLIITPRSTDGGTI